MKNYLLIFILGLCAGMNQVFSVDSRDQVLYVLPRTDQQAEVLKNITSLPEIYLACCYAIRVWNVGVKGFYIHNGQDGAMGVCFTRGFWVLSTQPEIFSVDLWKPDFTDHIVKNKEVHFYVNVSSVDEVKAQLNKYSITYSVLVDNAQDLIEQQTFNETANQRSSKSFYEQYHPLEDIYYWMEQMVEKHPDMLERIHIGFSFENRSLYVLKVNPMVRARDKWHTQEKAEINVKCKVHIKRTTAASLKLSGIEKTATNAIWIDCGIHAREWIAPAFCLWLIGHSIEYYNKDLSMTKLLRYFDFYILPVMNVDGYHYTWTTKRMWRKNRSKYPGSNCIGTDLNRNFDIGWCGAGASSNPCHDIYCGPYPESEPEVAAVVNFLKKHKDIVKGYISIHSYSQMVLFPYSYTTEKTKDHDELLLIANKVSEGIRATTRNRYIYGPGADTIYLAPGGSDDWAYDLGIKYSFTLELRDKGTYGFLLPPNLIRPTCSEALTGIKVIAGHIVKKL